MDIEKYNEFKEWLEEYYTDLEKAVKEIQEKYSPGYDSCTDIDFEFDTEAVVYAQFERFPTCGCCSSDYDGVKLPLDIVTSEGFERYIRERDEEIKRDKKNEVARKKREAKQKKAVAEKVRRETYEELRAEFGG